MKSGFVYLIVTTDGQFGTWLIREENQRLCCASRRNKSELAHWLRDSDGTQLAKISSP